VLNRPNITIASAGRILNNPIGCLAGLRPQPGRAQSRMPRSGFLKRQLQRLAIPALIILGLMVGVNRVEAQQITTLIEFTNVWKYDQSGLELGTAWRTNDYDDSNWSSGTGLLGSDTTPAVWTVHAPINSPLAISTTVTSYYFRTTFQFSGVTNGLSLLASNLVDDGCVIYLNGFQAGRLRVPQNQNATTFASAGTEGQIESLGLTNVARLRQGENLLAVEVHQSNFASEDVMWGMKLVAVEQLPLAITNQPQSQIIQVGGSVSFQVGVSGGPAFYRWQRDGVNISGATNSTYSIANTQTGQSGEYRAIITNVVNSVTSTVATLTLLPDTTGPRLISAIVRDIGATNRIVIQFSEGLQPGTVANSSSTNTANYRVTSCATGHDVTITTNAAQGGSAVQLTVGGSNWVIGDCYYLTVNNVTDSRTNRIAPDSRIPVQWPLHLDLVAADAAWSFHAAATFDGGVYDEDWTSADYLEGPWWAQGNGVFYGGPAPASVCLGSLQSLTGYQPEPMLFRTTFSWPADLSRTASLEVDAIIDEGMVLYLNGAEISRQNLPVSPTRISAATRATVAIAPTCFSKTVTVTNLLPGLNCLAAGVAQSTLVNGSATRVFGLTLIGSTTTFEPLPETPIPTLKLEPHDTNAVRLSWTGGGYALESVTNLTDNLASYPTGPWQEVPSMSNPFTNSLASPSRFFRLRK